MAEGRRLPDCRAASVLTDRLLSPFTRLRRHAPRNGGLHHTASADQGGRDKYGLLRPPPRGADHFRPMPIRSPMQRSNQLIRLAHHERRPRMPVVASSCAIRGSGEQVQNAIQAAEVEGMRRLGPHHRLGAVSDRNVRGGEHRQVVRAITDDDRQPRIVAELILQSPQ